MNIKSGAVFKVFQAVPLSLGTSDFEFCYLITVLNRHAQKHHMRSQTASKHESHCSSRFMGKFTSRCAVTASTSVSRCLQGWGETDQNFESCLFVERWLLLLLKMCVCVDAETDTEFIQNFRMSRASCNYNTLAQDSHRHYTLPWIPRLFTLVTLHQLTCIYDL